MLDMPRPRPPHLQREQTRHGTFVWYVRVGKGPRIRIKEAFGTPEFERAYHAALAGETTAPTKPKTAIGSLLWLVERYRETQAWTHLSMATRRQREAILRPILEANGSEPYSRITRKVVQAGMDRRRETPFQAKNFLATMSGLFKWALTAQHVETDPTAGLKAMRPKTEGFPVWT